MKGNKGKETMVKVWEASRVDVQFLPYMSPIMGEEGLAKLDLEVAKTVVIATGWLGMVEARESEGLGFWSWRDCEAKIWLEDGRSSRVVIFFLFIRERR